MRRLLCAAILLAAACFNVDQPRCSYACGPKGECPEDYQCLADGYCHLNGDTTACNFSDAAAAPDLSMPSSQPDSFILDTAAPAEPLDMAMTIENDM